MTTRSHSSSLSVQAARQRGSAYVFVLGICLIVTVMGMGSIALSRVSARTTSDGNDWEAAGTLAFSAVEHAISRLNAAAVASPAGWRSGYTSGVTAFTQTVGRGRFRWTIKDEIDGNLAANYLQSFRIYGIGTVGNVTRVYSVQVVPGGSALDVLRTALHSSRNITLGGTSRAVNGPISSNAAISLSGTINGAIEAASVGGSASGTRTLVAPAVAKSMPSSAVVDDYADRGTAISYNAIGGDELNNVLLSPAVNPYGTPNPDGIYVVTVPNNKKLTIKHCRIVGTLIVIGAKDIDINGPNLFESGTANAPVLIISSPGSTVTMKGNTTWLSESTANVNFNPASTPCDAASNATKTDDYPPQYRGIFHILVGSSGLVEMKENVYLRGTLITDSPVKTTDQLTLIQNPAYAADPPYGYATGDELTLVPGTWRWDTLP